MVGRRCIPSPRATTAGLLVACVCAVALWWAPGAAAQQADVRGVMADTRDFPALVVPPGLRATGFLGDSARWAPHDVRSYADGVDEGLLAAVPAWPRSVGAGSIVGTVGDLRRWYVALTAGRVVPADVAAAQFAPAVEIRPGARGGYAWSLVDVPTGTVRQVAGDIGGYHA